MAEVHKLVELPASFERLSSAEEFRLDELVRSGQCSCHHLALAQVLREREQVRQGQAGLRGWL